MARRASGISGLVPGISANVKHVLLRRRKGKCQWEKKTRRQQNYWKMALHLYSQKYIGIFLEFIGTFKNELFLKSEKDATSKKLMYKETQQEKNTNLWEKTTTLE